MEAVLLVGGAGTRLRPLTLTTPKPLLPTAGVPFLAHPLARLRAAGVDRVVLATSYRAELFAGVFGDGRRFGVQLLIATEETPLGTGGAIRRAGQLLCGGPDEPVLVGNGDVLSGQDLAALVRRHRDSRAAVTLQLTEVADARSYGCVPTDERGRVTAFLEKSAVPVSHQVNAGCYVFRRAVIDRIPADRPVSVERDVFPDLLRCGALLVGQLDQGYWLDVGTPGRFVQGVADLVRGVVPSPALPGRPGRRLVLPGAEVVDGARVTGGSSVEAGARVAGTARVHRSVLFPGAVVGDGARVVGSVVGRDARVGEGTVLVGSVIGDGARLGAGNELRTGARVWPGVRLPDRAVRFSAG